MYVIVDIAGKQEKVSPGDSVILDIRTDDDTTEIVMDKVLAYSKDGNMTFGTPYIEGMKVTAEVIEKGKMPKILVMKHVPKKAHEKITGHRQRYVKAVIKDIIGG